MDKILREIERNGNEGPNLAFFCPGCKCGHGVWTVGPNRRWSFNGNMDKPTFEPSILIERSPRCHLYVRDGQLHFLEDCEHEYKNRVVDMEPF